MLIVSVAHLGLRHSLRWINRVWMAKIVIVAYCLRDSFLFLTYISQYLKIKLLKKQFYQMWNFKG